MAEQFFVRMGGATDQATVVALNEDGHLLSGPESLPLTTLAGRAEGKSVTVLLPAEDIVSSVAEVPSASAARLRQMLPYSLEDEFAGDVDELHFAPGERNDNNGLAVSVIARERLDFWTGVLKAAGIHARRICSEADGVPDTPGSMTIFLEGERILGRRPGHAPFAFEQLGLADVWRLLQSESEESDDLDHVVMFVDGDALAARRDEIDAWREQRSDVIVKELAQGCLPKLASGLVFKAAPNLLQGNYASRSNLRTLARPWRAAAAFAVAFLALSVLGEGAELLKLSRVQGRLDQEATSICAESYGSEQLSRCRLEMGRRLADTGQVPAVAGSGFLPILAAVASAIDDAISIASISYRDQTLTLEVNTPNATYLDAFDQRLTQEGRFAFSMQNSTNEQDGSLTVRARIVAVQP